jgi:hypothetical protein
VTYMSHKAEVTQTQQDAYFEKVWAQIVCFLFLEFVKEKATRNAYMQL